MRISYLPTKSGEIDKYETYDICDFPYNKLDGKAMRCNRKAADNYIKQTFGTFDIETTTIGDKKNGYSGFMYHWQMCVDGFVCTGRYWNEWLIFLDKLIETLEVDVNQRFIIYVHNLGYEFQFMIDYLIAHYGSDFKVFATQKRKPIYISLSNGLEFRCSYKLSNMSLEKATESEKGVVHIKAAGDLDYRKMRTPSTKLTDTEFGYCVADVVSLYEYIKCKMHNDNDNLETIPITSTGYVRRDCRRSTRKDPSYKKLFKKLGLQANVYILLKECSRGGDTHANRTLSNRILHGMDSYDAVSSYPFQMLVKKFPMSKFMYYGEVDDKQTFEKLLGEYACLFRVVLTNVRLREQYAFPYIPLAKCTAYARSSGRYDNGRILSCDYIKMTVTDIDWKIINDQYEYDDIYISDFHVARYGYLPDALLNPIRDYLLKKSTLKMCVKQLAKEGKENSIEYEDAEYFMGKSKNKLNGIFGMTFTDPIHSVVEYALDTLDGNPWSEHKELSEEGLQEMLDKYQENRNSFLYYAWGCWVTCHARNHLAQLVSAIGQDLSAYCDTDSDKCIHSDESEQRVNVLNDEIIKLAEERKAYADVVDDQGETHRVYIGIYEKENKEPITEFKTLGAKKYAYNYMGELHVTVSGVNKKLAPQELGTIDNFVKGFIFRKAGGLELHYNDHVGIHDITVNGETFSSASNIGMVDSSYTLGVTQEYASILKDYETHD